MAKKKGPTRPLAARRAAAAAPRNRQPLRPTPAQLSNDACPVCGAATEEEGMLGCCGALVFSCSGSVAGVMCDELEEDDPRLDQVEWHSWYGDTGLPAPDERNADTGTQCRCGD